jgi:hypothetical protein
MSEEKIRNFGEAFGRHVAGRYRDDRMVSDVGCPVTGSVETEVFGVTPPGNDTGAIRVFIENAAVKAGRAAVRWETAIDHSGGTYARLLVKRRNS